MQKCLLITIMLTGCLLTAVAGDVVYRHNFADGLGNWSMLKLRDGAAVDCRAKITPGVYSAPSELISVTPGEVLAYSAKVKIPRPLNLGVYRLQAAVFDADGGVAALLTSNLGIDSTADWQTLRYVFKVPARGVKLQLRLLHNGEGEVQIAQVELRRPEAGSFERSLVPDYAGTLEEKKILHDWSLKCSGTAAPLASLDYLDKPQNTPYSIRLVRDNPFAPAAKGTVESIVEDDRPWPAALRKIDKVTFYYKVFHHKGDQFQLAVRFPEVLSGWGPMKNHWIAKLPLPTASPEWKFAELAAADFSASPGNWGSPEWQNADGMYFNLDFSGDGELGVKVAGVTIHYRDGSKGYPFQAWRDPFWYFPKDAGAKIQLPEPDNANVHGSGIYFLDSARGQKYFAALQQQLPNAAIQSNVYLRNLLNAREWLQKHNMAAGYQNATPYLWQAAVERDALAVPLESYEVLNERHHKADYTSEAWREIWRIVADRFGQYGIPEYQTIDSNFRVVPEKIDRNLAAVLNQTDGGILLNSGKVIHFWDYFETYTGMRWQPTDLGYQNWGEHRTLPTNFYAAADSSPTNRKRGYLDTAVRHYCFVRFFAAASQEFARNKVRFYLMNNGDDWRSGNDWIFNVRSLQNGGFVDENYFYHPATVLKAYHLGLVHRQVFADNPLVRHRLIGESGKGGHGIVYWAPEYSYAALFAVCAATRYDSFEMDWPGEELLDNLTPDNAYQYDRFCDYWAKSLAYNHATLNDRLTPLLPLNQVISLQETRAMYAGEHSGKMSTAAEKLSLPVSRVMPDVLDDRLLDRSTLVINDCYALPVGMADKLLAWVNGGTNRILLLHGVAAGNVIDGTQWSEAFGWARNRINAPDQFAAVLGKLTFAKDRTLPSLPGSMVFRDVGGLALSFYPAAAKGSGIYFYTYTPGTDLARDGRILTAIFKRHRLDRGITSAGNELYVRSYRSDSGKLVFPVFDKKTLDEYPWVYAATDNGVFPYRKPGQKAAETVTVEPGKYCLFGMLSGKEQTVEVGSDRQLLLELNDATAEVFYLLHSSDRSALEQIKRQREDLFRYLSKRK